VDSHAQPDAIRPASTDEPRYPLSNRDPGLDPVRACEPCFCREQRFCNQKVDSFQPERSRLRDPARIDRLLPVVACDDSGS